MSAPVHPCASLLLLLLLSACARHASGPDAIGLALADSCPTADPAQAEADARAFLADFEMRLAPLEKAMNLASWKASTTGDEAAWDEASRYELELRTLMSDSCAYQRLKAWRDGALITDPLVVRQVQVLTDAFAENQIDPALAKEMVEMGQAIAEDFTKFRGTLDGQEINANSIMDILKSSTDSARRKGAWEASKQVGPVLADRIRELVRLRNKAARSLGYNNYYEMSLLLDEEDPATIRSLFDAMDQESREPFAQAKADLDARLAQRYGIQPAELQPWHYEDPFFQEAPKVAEVSFDALYQGKDVLEIATRFYEGIGLEVKGVLSRSDLNERPGKEQSAFATDIDRLGDIRILCNVRNDDYWMDTVLHELGHATYDEYIDPSLPFILRGASHSTTTEAIALFFGRLAKSPSWLRQMVGVPDAQLAPLAVAGRDTLRLQMLVFTRWSLVLVNFERGMYEDPEQDLDALWWSLVEKYQMIHRPEGRKAQDWATKTHVVLYPVYYHNYLIGDMMASQMLHAIDRDLLGGVPLSDVDLVGRPDVGDWLKTRIFAPGTRVRWDQLIQDATGEPLTPKYMVDQFMRIQPAVPR